MGKICYNQRNKQKKLGVLPKVAERKDSNPLNLMWLMPTEGSETRKANRPFPDGRRSFLYEKILCRDRKEEKT